MWKVRCEVWKWNKENRNGYNSSESPTWGLTSLWWNQFIWPRSRCTKKERNILIWNCTKVLTLLRWKQPRYTVFLAKKQQQVWKVKCKNQTKKNRDGCNMIKPIYLTHIQMYEKRKQYSYLRLYKVWKPEQRGLHSSEFLIQVLTLLRWN